MATDVGTLQGKLELDMSGFNTAINQATNLVRQFGQQLQGALGSTATQGFSATNQAVQSLAAEMLSLTTNAQNLISVLGQINTQMQGFLNTMQTSSSRGNNMNNAARGANQLNQNLGRANRNASDTAQNTRNISSGANKAANNAKKISSSLQLSGKEAADVKHILEGIVISQSFYQVLGIMRELVSNANEFMVYMEQSAISFKYLLGSTESASGFLTALQDFAVSSPLDMQGATKSARLLMTMGVEANNVVGVLRVLTDTAVVAGGDMEDSIYRISLALGQMLQSGTVKAQEIRQLVNANVPIFEILREELGLTASQIANIGQEGINSATAVNAILHGLQKRFKGASIEMQQTLTGAISASKDSFYVLYNIMMQSPFNSIRDKVVSLSEALQYLAQVARNFGIGGVFEAIVPGWLQPYIRNIVGAFIQLGYALKYTAAVASDLFGAAFVELSYVFNLVLPPITIFLNAILQLAHYLLQTYPIVRYIIAAFLSFSILTKIGSIVLWFWKIMGIGKICLVVSQWITNLVKALSWLAAVMVTHPAVLILTLIAGAALAATGALQKLVNKFKELLSLIGVKWAKMNKTLHDGLNIGYDPNKILQPTANSDNQKKAEAYNGTLQNIAGSLSDVGNEADKAGKKLKQNFNQSFDEVYTINPNQDTANDLGLGGLGDIDLSDAIGQLDDFNSSLNDISGFNLGGWDQDFIAQWDDIWANIKGYLQNFGLGALLAGILTTLLTGNPWIGLAAALAALLWPAIAEALGLTETQGQTILGAALGALIGAVIAKICGVGFLTGAVWAGIGALIFAGLWPAIQEYMDSGDWRKAIQALNFTLFGAGIGALIGNLICPGIGTALGGLIGAALGSGINDAVKAWADGKDGWGIADAVNWTIVGAGIGALIGTLVAPGIGTAIGVAIGGLSGSIVDNIVSLLAEIDGDWTLLGDAFKLWGQDIATAFKDGLFGDGGLFGWSTEIFSWAGEFFSDVSDAFAEGDWLRIGKDVLLGILAGIAGAITCIFEPISRVFQAVVEALCAIFGIHSPATEMEPYGKNILLGLLNGIVNAISNIPTYLASVGTSIFQTVSSWFTTIYNNASTWLSNTTSSISTFATNTFNSVSTWANNTATSISTWATNTANNVATWASNTKGSVTTWYDDTKTKISDWATNTYSSVSGWFTNVTSVFDSFKQISFTDWCNSIYTTISTWASNIWSSIKDCFDKAIDKVKEFFNIGGKQTSISIDSDISGGIGHANGGIYDREHWAKFSEGNKREAIIPLENDSAMQPFVTAVADGLTASLAPIFSSMKNGNNEQSLQPLYVGTLIADDRSLEELQRKLNVISLQENERRF